jgi:phosphoglycolate phosphatase
MFLPSLHTLLFDLDGTLTDPKEGITACIQHALICLGRLPPSADELEWCIGPPLLGSFERLLADASPDLAWEAVRLYRERYTQHGIFESYPYPGVPEMLAALRNAGFHLFIATSKPTPFARRVLEQFQLAEFFVGIYGSELDGTRNDKAELIAHLLVDRGLEGDRAVMVGDRKHDVIAAQRNGVMPVGVSYGYGSVEELEGAGAVKILANPLAVQQYLLGLAPAGSGVRRDRDPR